MKYLRIPIIMACELRASLYSYAFINTDVNQFLIIRYRLNFCIGMLIKCCMKNDSLSAESLIVMG